MSVEAASAAVGTARAFSNRPETETRPGKEAERAGSLLVDGRLDRDLLSDYSDEDELEKLVTDPEFVFLKLRLEV